MTMYAEPRVAPDLPVTSAGQTPRRDRISNLTGIRAFAAIWVVLYHFQTTEVISNFDMGGIIARGYLGVDVFFVLSGFILALNYGNAPTSGSFFTRDFIVRRFARIYPLHAVMFAASAVAFSAGTAAGHSFVAEAHNNWWTALANIFNVHAWGVTGGLNWNGPSWSVSAEWFAYLLLFPLLVRVLTTRSIRFGVGVTTTLWGFLIAYAAIRHGGELDAVTSDGIARIIPEFTAGFVVCRICTTKNIHADVARSARRVDLLVAASLVGLALISVGPLAGWVFVLPVVACLIGALYQGGRLTDRLFGSRPAVWLGELSFAIYMVHVLVQISFNVVLGKMTLAPSLAVAAAVLALEIAVTLFVAIVAHRVVEVPARRRIVQRFSPIPA